MVRSLRPDQWPFATDDERAAGWREPLNDRRHGGGDRRTPERPVSAAPLRDDVYEDVTFLRALANRISAALYHETVKPVGPSGLVSLGLLHDDYDRLRSLAKRMEIASAERYLAELKATPDK